jgi:hypothetical protein
MEQLKFLRDQIDRCQRLSKHVDDEKTLAAIAKVEADCRRDLTALEGRHGS